MGITLPSTFNIHPRFVFSLRSYCVRNTCTVQLFVRGATCYLAPFRVGRESNFRHINWLVANVLELPIGHCVRND